MAFSENVDAMSEIAVSSNRFYAHLIMLGIIFLCTQDFFRFIFTPSIFSMVINQIEKLLLMIKIVLA